MTVDFDTELKYPEDLHYPKEIEHSPMQPFNLGEMNFSHEPFYLKYKNMHKANLVTLKKIIMLTKWDGKNNEEKKLKIIDDIMTGKISFDSYKYQVFHENGITQEQEHLFDNIDEKSLFDFKKPENEKKDVIVKSKMKVDEEGTVTETPFNINHKSEKEIRMEKEDVDKILDKVFDRELKNDYDKLLNSNFINFKDKNALIKFLEEIVNEATGDAIDKQKRIQELKKQLQSKTESLKKIEVMSFKDASQNKTILLGSGIGLCVVGIIVFLYLIQTKKINVNFNNIVAGYGG
jgi:hypothetical protein